MINRFQASLSSVAFNCNLRHYETVSADGTHLGHNLPDRTGNRYCINLVSVAGRPL